MCPEVDSDSESEYQRFSWGKGGRYVCLTTYHPCSAKMSRKSRVLTYPEPLGPPWPVAGDLYFTFTHILQYVSNKYKTFIMGNNVTCIIYCNYRIAATPYKLGCLQVYYCEYTNNKHDDGEN